MKKELLIFLIAAFVLIEFSVAQIPYPADIAPGAAKLKTLADKSVVLGNAVIRMRFVYDGKKIALGGFEDKNTHEQLNTGGATELFELALEDGSVITSSAFVPLKPPVLSVIVPQPHAATYANRLGGLRYAADMENKKSGLRVHWEADLRDGSSYVRQFFRFAAGHTTNISKIVLLKLPLNIGIKKEGAVDGSPLAHRNMFFAIEHPMSQVEQSETSMLSYLMQMTPLTPGKPVDFSTVWGTTPAGQLRRGFLYYLERERSMPYRQMLHYNSWFDISSAGHTFNEGQVLDRIKMYRDSFIVKRHVQLDAFLMDDGWDNYETLWQFNKGFPNGFTKLNEAVASCNSSIGVWLSPFGGYGEDKEKRIAFGKKQNPPFEMNDNGFSLSGPVYYRRILEVTGNFVKKYHVSMFKFDGVGPGNDAVGAGVAYHNDIEAFLRLLKDLKRMNPHLYLDLTTGTWPSPYWLMYGDNIWRSGGDYGLKGDGSKWQQEITYRDASTYKNVVEAGPLYPLNALMNGGIIIADTYRPGFEMNDQDIADDIWSFFGTGVSLQELYVNPHRLNTATWDCLAKASNWSRANERVMADVHWVGGDPAKGELYGYAAWSPRKAVLMLRNPSKEEGSFQFDAAVLFELPSRVKNNYLFYDVKTGNREAPGKDGSFTITLQPFEVKVLDAYPARLNDTSNQNSGYERSKRRKQEIVY